MKKIFSKELIIGILVLVALVILFVGIDFLKGVNVLQKQNTYYISYANVQGLTVSAPVTVSGYKIGQVRAISYEYDNPGHVRVDIDIHDELRLPEGTNAILQTDLLGTASIVLSLGTSDKMIKAGSELTGIIPEGLMDVVSNNLLPSVSNVFPRIDTLLVNVNSIVSNPALRKSIERLDILTSNLVTTTSRINALVATLPPITSDVKIITDNFAKTSYDLNVLANNVSNLPIDSLVTSLQSTLDNLHEISGELNNGLKNPDSTIGQLMRNPDLYNNLNHSIQSLDSLFVDIKKNPKRYISIKLL